jgi:hypothetical protein
MLLQLAIGGAGILRLREHSDDEAIAEAVQRPTMHFVTIKTPEQMDLLCSGQKHVQRCFQCELRVRALRHAVPQTSTVPLA